jgi:hypothetical protein
MLVLVLMLIARIKTDTAVLKRVGDPTTLNGTGQLPESGLTLSGVKGLLRGRLLRIVIS